MKHVLHEVEGGSIDLQSAQHNFFSLLVFEEMRKYPEYLMQNFIGDVFEGGNIDSIQEKMDNLLSFSSRSLVNNLIGLKLLHPINISIEKVTLQLHQFFRRYFQDLHQK